MPVHSLRSALQIGYGIYEKDTCMFFRRSSVVSQPLQCGSHRSTRLHVVHRQRCWEHKTDLRREKVCQMLYVLFNMLLQHHNSYLQLQLPSTCLPRLRRFRSCWVKEKNPSIHNISLAKRSIHGKPPTTLDYASTTKECAPKVFENFAIRTRSAQLTGFSDSHIDSNEEMCN